MSVVKHGMIIIAGLSQVLSKMMMAGNVTIEWDHR